MIQGPEGQRGDDLTSVGHVRRAQFTIFAAKDAETLDTWFNNPMWVWRSDAACIATTAGQLEIALHAAKISLAAAKQEGAGGLDPAALQAEAQNLASAMAALRSIWNTAETIMNSAKNNGNRIRREARRMGEQVVRSINRMRLMVGLQPDDTLTNDLPQIEEDAA